MPRLPRLTPAVQTFTCRQCGMDFEHKRRGGMPPVRCPECRNAPKTPQNHSAGYVMALEVVRYRLAIEMTTALLRTGRVREALAVLETVQAPTR